MKKNHTWQRGAALLITLAFIVMISILIVGFAASMRTDRPAANMYLEKTRASLYAQAGVEAVIATLRQNTADTNRYWISQPGQIVAGSATDNSATTVDERKVLSVAVPLHSGAAPSPAPTDPVLQPCNLNVTTLRDPTTSLITDRPDVNNPAVHALMQVGWIYIRQDGTHDTSQTPTVNAANPIVGRLAYWTDDESSKVNYNLAWGRTTTPPNTNQVGNPTKVTLAALTGLTAPMADAIHNYITDTSMGVNFQSLNHGFFNTPEDARQVDQSLAGVSSALTTNKFELTHYNNDPDTTFFNQPRIVLTTQTNRAGGRPCLNLGTNNVLGLADLSNANAAMTNQYNATVQMLVQYLQRTDWPVAPNSSFQQKYYGSYPANRQLRLMQLAINIIDYVRSKESPAKVVIPSRGYITGGTNFQLSQDTSTNALGNPANQVFVGIARAPRINEMGMWWERVQTSPAKYKPRFKVELYLPRNYGISSIDLKGEWYGMYFAFLPSVALGAVTDPTGPPIAGSYRFDVTDSQTNYIALSTSVLNAGGYATASWTVYGTNTIGDGTYPWAGRVMGLRAALYQYPNATTTTSYSKVDFAPLLANYTNTAYYTNDPAGTAQASIHSIEVDDPRINTFGGVAGVGGDWVPNTLSTFDAQNSRYSVGKAVSTVTPQPGATDPQMDTDTSGNISDASLYMPPPAGAMFTNSDGSVTDNTLGIVTSVGELGYIDTGMESTAKAGVNWRTLRLQTSAFDNTVVPDWALMDLFTVPSTASSAATNMTTPYGTSYAGRVNLNSLVTPFDMARTLPLSAVLLGASATPTSTVSSANAQLLAANIYNHTLSPVNSVTGAYGKQYGYLTAYDSPGEVIEAQGIGDQGEAGEALIRDIANLITARGNVFSVYTVGQALKQTPTGTLTITGEQRLQAMVERYLNSSGVVQFRTVYFRNLTP